MKKSSGRIAKIIRAICIALTIGLAICYTTSCSLDILDSILNTETDPNKKPSDNDENNHQKPTNPDNQGGGNDGNIPIFPDENSDNNQTKDIILRLDFDGHDTHELTGLNARYINDRIFAKWSRNSSRAPGALRDNHGRVCELNGIPSRDGSSAYVEVEVNVPVISVLTFEMRSEMYYQNCLFFKVDGGSARITHSANGDGWIKQWTRLNKGRHTIRWELPRQQGYSPDLTNVVLLDNITIAPDRVEYVEIYPKGLQETYVDGNTIKFTAKPLRGDRTEIYNKNIRYEVSGCGTIDSDGYFRPTSKGQCTVTAYVDGKAAQKSNIYVHGRNYLSDEVKLGNYTFTGQTIVTPIPGYTENLDTHRTKYDYSVTPMDVSFDADGFFIIKGNTQVPLWFNVIKDGTKYETHYFVRYTGDFYKRIWLRFGPGKYVIKVYEATNLIMSNPQDRQYEGDIRQYGGTLAKTLIVNNTNRMPTNEAIYLMPSELVQCDDFTISNIAHNVIADLPSNATKGDKLKALHDWEIHYLYYDNVSLNHVDQRKRQDALATVRYATGVCEGYANLYAALLRSIGYKAQVIVDTHTLQHAWNRIEYNGQDYLMDVTWDDPVTSNADSYNDRASNAENYTYFLTSFTDDKHIVEGEFDTSRNINSESELPKMVGLPDGYY